MDEKSETQAILFVLDVLNSCNDYISEKELLEKIRQKQEREKVLLSLNLKVQTHMA